MTALRIHVAARTWRVRRAGRPASVLMTLVLLAAWWLLLAPSSLGGPATYVMVRGDSMLPTLEGGDLVILHARNAYDVGDVVAYRVPANEIGAGRIVIHRIVAGDGVAGLVLLGDSNPAPDPWRPTSDAVIGTPWLRIPALGRLIAMLQEPALAASLAAAIAVGFVAYQSGNRPPPDGRLDGARAGRGPIAGVAQAMRSAGVRDK